MRIPPGSNREQGSVLPEDSQDRLFHALADQTRRDILRRCMNAEPSVSELARKYPMSVHAVQKHVSVLESAGLVSREKHGREQLVHTELPAVRKARQMLERLESLWRGRADRMADLLDEVPGTSTEGSSE